MSDLRVNVELGATLPFDAGGGFGNVKPVISISGIDPEADVEKQIELGIEVAKKAFVRIDEQLDISVSEILSTDGVPGYRQKVDLIERDVKALRTTMENLLGALTRKGLVEAVSGKKDEGK